MKLQPFGAQLIVLPVESKNHITTAGIEIVQTEWAVGVVVEVSKEYSYKFTPGDTVIYSKDAGIGIFYANKNCLCIDGRSIEAGGSVYFKVTEDKVAKDKGDSL